MVWKKKWICWSIAKFENKCNNVSTLTQFLNWIKFNIILSITYITFLGSLTDKPINSSRTFSKNIPQPSNPLKSFNWCKLPEVYIYISFILLVLYVIQINIYLTKYFLQSKLEGTVWEELDDTRLYKEIDLRDFDKTFSAYQKQQVRILKFFMQYFFTDFFSCVKSSF